jgi:hypothetical protein
MRAVVGESIFVQIHDQWLHSVTLTSARRIIDRRTNSDTVLANQATSFKQVTLNNLIELDQDRPTAIKLSGFVQISHWQLHGVFACLLL